MYRTQGHMNIMLDLCKLLPAECKTRFWEKVVSSVMRGHTVYFLKWQLFEPACPLPCLLLRALLLSSGHFPPLLSVCGSHSPSSLPVSALVLQADRDILGNSISGPPIFPLAAVSGSVMGR